MTGSVYSFSPRIIVSESIDTTKDRSTFTSFEKRRSMGLGTGKSNASSSFFLSMSSRFFTDFSDSSNQTLCTIVTIGTNISKTPEYLFGALN